jgi:molecular chaperone DnaK
MKHAQERLTKASHKLAEIMYREAQTQHGGAGAQGDTRGAQSGPKEGEVVDAEFEDLNEKK